MFGPYCSQIVPEFLERLGYDGLGSAMPTLEEWEQALAAPRQVRGGIVTNAPYRRYGNDARRKTRCASDLRRFWNRTASYPRGASPCRISLARRTCSASSRGKKMSLDIPFLPSPKGPK